MDKLIIDDKKFKGLVSSICRDITNSYWRPDYIVGITRGGLTAATMISHYLDCRMETLNVKLRDSKGGLGPESNLWMAEDAFGYDQDIPTPNILIVDDINDTGATLNWIIEDWKSGCMPKDPRWEKVWNNNVRFAVIVDNSASRFNALIDYAGMTINKAEKDVWVEFPYENWWA